jgi:TolB-like protein
LAQLNRLQSSAAFAGSGRLIVLLRFIVTEALNGAGGSLKEAVIGNAVYGREPAYDPRIDSTVRVEMRRLRRKLKDYYTADGQADPVLITLATGHYVPSFAWNMPNLTATHADGHAPDVSGPIFEKGSGAALAVMPFRALSRDPEDETFAEGLTDELIFALGRAKGLRIASRAAVYQYRDKPYSPIELASAFGFDAILQGAVRREGELIRVTIEVSDPTGFVVLSDRFDAPGTERMQLQERIAATMLNRIRLDSSHMSALQIRPGPAALEANAKIYTARQLLDRQTPSALREALDIFVDVSRTAPDYARGHSGIADCHCDLFRLGLIDHAAASVAAKRAARKALEIDPKSVEAHTASATIAAWLDRNGPEAEAWFEKALQLGENARAARLHAVLLTIFERHDEAERRFREARAIEPFSSQQDIAESVSHYQARRHHLLIGDEATARNSARQPVEVLFYRALAEIFGGQPELARPLAMLIEAEARGRRDLVFARAEIEAWLGEPERGQALLTSPNSKATAFARATLAAALRDNEGCLEAIEVALARRELSTVWLRTDPRFDRLRGSERFQRLLDQLSAQAAA